MKKVLVIGGMSFIRSNLIARLLLNGYVVTYPDNLSAVFENNIAESVSHELFKHIKEETNTSLNSTYGKEQQGDVKHSLTDIIKAMKYLVYHPKFDIKQGLKLIMNGIKGK
ncbi:MAG: hypothetical protein AAFY41_00710 [Bacteroidota bacterium]